MKFLAVTDLHYSERNIPGEERQNYLSAQKLRSIIDSYADGCDFIAELGDTADDFPGKKSQAQLMGEIADILSSSGVDYHCLIGNHDTSLPKQDITRILSMPHRYYSFETDEYLCLVLDPNMNDVNKPYPESEIHWAYTFLDDEQLGWINSMLENTEKDVLVFSHEVMMLENIDVINDHIIMNRDKALEIFERSGKVKAVFTGHYHYGDYVKHNGISYLTFGALCLYDDETFALVEIENKKVTVEGHGRQKSMEFYLD
ncbi:MAG: metallophosphoesterase [Clostridia bacterium]|nr:metallophosphoesterase [Clostridia bacterium]